MRALQIALVGMCLAVVYTGLAPILGAAALEPAVIPPVEAPATGDLSLHDYQVIATRNLFRARSPAPVAEASEELKESELRLKLCGTYAAVPAERSVACIDDQGTQKRRAFRVGQEIASGVKLVAVERRRAVIDNRGSREQLTMEENAAPGAIMRAPSPQPTPRAAPRTTQRLSDRLRELRERPVEANTDAIRPKLQSALESAQISPVYDDSGQFGGVKLNGIRPGGVFAGLPEDTVCFELNGTRLDSVQTLPQALATASASDSGGQTCLRCRQPDGIETVRCL
jgi:type II secretory pathway component PulC